MFSSDHIWILLFSYTGVARFCLNKLTLICTNFYYGFCKWATKAVCITVRFSNDVISLDFLLCLKRGPLNLFEFWWESSFWKKKMLEAFSKISSVILVFLKVSCLVINFLPFLNLEDSAFLFETDIQCRIVNSKIEKSGQSSYVEMLWRAPILDISNILGNNKMVPLQIAWLVDMSVKPLIFFWENLEHLGQFLNAVIYEHQTLRV